MSWRRLFRAPHETRGGWSWHTGSAAWKSRAAVEGIPGLRRGGGYLVITPRLPDSWPGFAARLRVEATDNAVSVQRGDDRTSRASSACALVPLDEAGHEVVVMLT